MASKNSGKRLQLLLGALISAASLFMIFLFVDPRELLQSVRSTRFSYLGVSAIGFTAFLFLRAVRWRFILDNSIGLARVFHIQNIGYLLTFILPFRLGDVARAVLIGNVPPVTLPQGLSTVVVERVLDLFVIVTLLPFTLAAADTSLPPAVQDAARVSGGVALAGIVLLVMAANRRPLARRLLQSILKRVAFLDETVWTNRADELLKGLSSLTRVGDGLVVAFLSVLVWAPVVFAYYMGMLAVHLEPTPTMAALVVCAAAISITIPSAPGYWGVIQAAIIFAMVTILGMPEDASASFAFLYHTLNFIVSVILGLIGIYGVGATFENIVTSTRMFAGRERDALSS